MPTLTIRTRYTFGDRVRFDSKLQRCAGVGKVFAITVDADCHVDYMIEIDLGGSHEIQPGILENEITLLRGSDVV